MLSLGLRTSIGSPCQSRSRSRSSAETESNRAAASAPTAASKARAIPGASSVRAAIRASVNAWLIESEAP